MHRYLLLALLLLGGCDSQTREYNTALEHLANRELEQALPVLTSLAEAGYAPAQFRLGMMFAEGFGIQQNWRQAAQWFERAAQQNDVGAQWTLARLYRVGRGVRKSDTLALRWYQQLAEQGFAPAQFQVGMMYREGLGTARDLTQAEHWLRQAAERGFRPAMAEMVKAYRDGELGLSVDPEQARAWQEKAQIRPF